MRELGVDIGLQTDGRPPPHLDPQADATAYRVAQQAVSNALQHAPGARVLVEMERTATHLELSVLNGPPQQHPVESPGGDAGLQVMRERVAAVDGRLRVGPTPQGGWRVRLSLPLTQEDA